MQLLTSHLLENGYHLSDITPDSRIHRFKREPQDKDKSAWYVCHQAHSPKSGQIFYILVYGDWRTGETHKFNTLHGATTDDNIIIARQIEKAMQEREAEQVRVYEEAALRSAKEWDSYTDAANHPYLERKQVKPYGLRCDVDGNLIVPIRDRQGKMWGYQRISDTDKRFVYGCKVRGNFHVLGTLQDDAFLAEGYATAASIHEATGKPVIIAFNAGNLPAVAACFPDLRLTVCGDDDQFKAENAGRKYAEKCGASKVIYPKFRDLTTKPTDFNDLHVLEGLQAVKSQILGDKTPRQFVLPLGHAGENYYYTSSSNRQIVSISRGQHSRSILLDLMPMTYWEARYPGATGPNFTAAADHLMSKARERGIYDEENIRGVGVWRDSYQDQERFVINLGDGLFTDQRLQVDDFKSKYIYEIGKRLPEPVNAAVDKTVLPNLLSVTSFKHPDSRLYFLGFLTVAPVAGALDWRPHIWLNGGSNTGKSTIMQVVAQVLGPYRHYFQGQSTEAGIRQTTRNDSKPVMFDEFEADDTLGQARLNLILELVRQASSETDGHVAKGSPGGNAVTARPKFCAMFSSIRIPALNEADRTRITDIELEWIKDAEKFDRFKTYAAMITPEFSNAYISRTFRLLPILRKNIEIFWDVLRRQHSARIGQQYGTLLAGAWLARNDAAVTQGEAEAVCEKLSLEDAKQSLVNREEMECLDHLCNSVIRLEGGAVASIRELIDRQHTVALGRNGVMRKDDMLYVASSNPELTKIYRDTRWHKGWAKSLSRLAGAAKSTKYINGKSQYCVGFSVDLALEENS